MFALVNAAAMPLSHERSVGFPSFCPRLWPPACDLRREDSGGRAAAGEEERASEQNAVKRRDECPGQSGEEWRGDVGSAQQRENSRGLNSITWPSMMKTERWSCGDKAGVLTAAGTSANGGMRRRNQITAAP